MSKDYIIEQENDMMVSEPSSVYGIGKTNKSTINSFNQISQSNQGRMTVDDYFEKLWSTVKRRYEIIQG